MRLTEHSLINRAFSSELQEGFRILEIIVILSIECLGFGSNDVRPAADAAVGGRTARHLCKTRGSCATTGRSQPGQGKAERQTELTQSAIAVEIAKKRGQAQFAEAEQLAKKQVMLAEGEARAKELIGKGESSRIAHVGLAEAAVTLQKVSAFRDPRLYALNVFADQFSKSVQPLVPSRLFISNAGGTPGEGQGAGSVLETLLNLILSEKAGITRVRAPSSWCVCSDSNEMTRKTNDR